MTGYKNGKARPPLGADPHVVDGAETTDPSPPDLRDLRDNQGRFRPGVSGCPGGRSRAELEIRTLAQSHGPAAIERLLEITKSKDERVAVAACEALLNRGCGTPRQSIDLDASVSPKLIEPTEPITLEDAERAYLELVHDRGN